MNPRESLVFYYRLLRTHGNNDSHSGNASVREAGCFWVTPTGACADTLQVEDLAECSIDGELG